MRFISHTDIIIAVGNLVVIWDITKLTQKIIYRPNKNLGGVCCLAVSPNDEFVALGGWKNGQIVIWDPIGYGELCKFEIKNMIEQCKASEFADNRISKIAISNIGTVAALGMYSNAVIVRSYCSGKTSKILFDCDVVNVMFLENERLIIIDEMLNVVEYDCTKDKNVISCSIVDNAYEQGLRCFELDSCKSKIAVSLDSTGASKLAILDSITLELINLHEISSSKIAFYDESHLIVYNGNSVNVISIDDFSVTSAFNKTFSKCSARDGSKLFVLGNAFSGNVVFDTNFNEIGKLVFPSAIEASILSDDDRYIGISTVDGVFYLLDAVNGNQLKYLKYTDHIRPRAIAFSPDCKFVAISGISKIFIIAIDTGAVSVIRVEERPDQMFFHKKGSSLLVIGDGAISSIGIVSGEKNSIVCTKADRMIFDAAKDVFYAVLTNEDDCSSTVIKYDNNKNKLKWTVDIELKGKLNLLFGLSDDVLMCASNSSLAKISLNDGSIVDGCDFLDLGGIVLDQKNNLVAVRCKGKDAFNVFDIENNIKIKELNIARSKMDWVESVSFYKKSNRIVSISFMGAIVIWSYKTNIKKISFKKEVFIDSEY